MTSKDYIEALEQKIGAPVASEGGDVYALAFNSRGMLLRWQEAQNAFALHFEIGALSATDRLGQCVRLLSSNFLMQETGGGALSLNPADGSIGLNLMLHADGISTEEFLARLDEASHIALAWTARVSAMQAELEERASLLMDEITRHAVSEGIDPAVDSSDAEMPSNMFILRV